MYEQVFNFNSRPFTTTPYVRHYFAASSIHQAIGQANICVERGSGPVVAIGGIGVGKSLFLEMLQSHFQNHFVVVTIACSRDSSRREFLQNILFQLGRPTDAGDEAQMRFAIIEAAKPDPSCPNGILLLVDDAEVLSSEIFDELRLLMNFVVEGVPRIRLVLAGRKSLEDRLAEPGIASFSQRIASRVFLQNLNREETSRYVVEHIDRVGGSGQVLFPQETNAKLHDLTDGCPRQINQVCDFVLILAGTRGLNSVSPALIDEAWSDVQSLPSGQSLAPAMPVTNSPADWTVIEFGQLDDDGADESTATNEIEFAPLDEADSVAAANVIKSQNDSSVDPDLGIDLAALQAMRDAHSGKSDEPVSSGAVSGEPFVPATAAIDSEEPGMDSYSSTIAGPVESTSVAQSPDTNEGAVDGIESQLAAVFGTMQPEASKPQVESVESTSLVTQDPSENGGHSPGVDPKLGAFHENKTPLAGVPNGVDQNRFGVEQFQPMGTVEDTSGASFSPPVDSIEGGVDESIHANQEGFETLSQEHTSEFDESLNDDERASQAMPSEGEVEAEAVQSEIDPLAEFQASLAKLRAGNQDAWGSAPTPASLGAMGQPFDSDGVSDNVCESENGSEIQAGGLTLEEVDQPSADVGAIRVVAESSRVIVEDSLVANHVEFPVAAQEDNTAADNQPIEIVQHIQSQENETAVASDESSLVCAEEVASSGVESPFESSFDADNPFAESFEQVESVVDRFAPEIVTQNQNALEITSADLKHVQPLSDDPFLSPQDGSAATPSFDSVAPGLPEAHDLRSEIEPDRQAAEGQGQRNDSLGSVDASRLTAGVPVGVNWVTEEYPGGGPSSAETANASPAIADPVVADPVRQEEVNEALTERLNANTPMRGFTVSPPSPVDPVEPVAKPVVQRDESIASADGNAENTRLQFYQAESNPSNEDRGQADVNSGPSGHGADAGLEFVRPAYLLGESSSAGTSELPSPQVQSDFVQQQTEQNNPVTSGGGASSGDAEEPAELQASSLPNKKEFREEHLNEAASEEISRQADEILQRLQRSSSTAKAPAIGVTPEQDAEDSGIQILDEIRKQQQLVAGVYVSSEASRGAGQDRGESVQTPRTLPMVSHGQHTDDSEMLVVENTAEPPAAIEPGRSASSPLDIGDQVSTGRAKRMNYEQLFDRLRDLPEGD